MASSSTSSSASALAFDTNQPQQLGQGAAGAVPSVVSSSTTKVVVDETLDSVLAIIRSAVYCLMALLGPFPDNAMGVRLATEIVAKQPSLRLGDVQRLLGDPHSAASKEVLLFSFDVGLLSYFADQQTTTTLLSDELGDSRSSFRV
jgi:hypothetical protein